MLNGVYVEKNAFSVQEFLDEGGQRSIQVFSTSANLLGSYQFLRLIFFPVGETRIEMERTCLEEVDRLTEQVQSQVESCGPGDFAFFGVDDVEVGVVTDVVSGAEVGSDRVAGGESVSGCSSERHLLDQIAYVFHTGSGVISDVGQMGPDEGSHG